MKIDQIAEPQSSLPAARGLSRREILSAASLAALGLVTSGGRANEPTPPVPVAGSTNTPAPQGALEDFIYDIEHASGGWQGKGGTAMEATVEEFPLSQSIAGVSMRLNPGAFRELHWHSIAAEWAYVLEGRVRTTVISPEGTTATDDFEVGDIWYFPKGHGHMLQCVGDQPCHFLLGFDSGHFSEFGTFSVTDWVSHTRPDIIARNLGLPVDAIRAVPKKELYIGTGPIAGDTRPRNIDPGLEQSQSPHKFSLLHAHPENFPGGSIRVVSQKEFPINTTLTSALMTLKPGTFRELHWHPNADEWQYVISGSGQLTLFGSHGRVKTMDYDKGKVAFIKQGYGHFIENTGNEEMKILILFNAPDYQEIALSAWLAANPVQLVSDHFGMNPSIVADLRQRRLGIAPAHEEPLQE
jgi:oxalate decarboxylase